MTKTQASFSRFDECTQEDMTIIGKHMKSFASELPIRVMDHLKLLDGDFGGFPVDRLEHSLQTATRAHRDGRDEEYVICCLLHDIGDTLGTFNHGAIAAAIVEPFVSDANRWMMENHTTFQGYYFFEFVGGDKNSRDKFKDHEHYEHTKEFIDKYDMPSFDNNYDSMSTDDFMPMLTRVLQK